MSLKDMTVATGATISVADGTPVVFAEDGVTIANGIHLVATSDPDFRTRRQVTAKSRAATYDYKTNSYAKEKRSVVYVVPTVDINSKTVFNTVRIEVEFDPTLDTGDKQDLLKVGAQLLVDSDLEEFWATGARS